MNTKSNHIQYLQPLLFLSKFFGITLTSNKKPANIFCTIYSASLAILLTLVYFEMLLLKISYSPDLQRNLVFALMDTLCELFLIISNVSSIIDTAILKRRLTVRFMELLPMKRFNRNYYKRRQKIFLGEFICVMTCVVLYHVYHIYTFLIRVPNFPQYVFFREISVYLTVLNLLQLYNFVLIIRDKFVFLNRALRRDIYFLKYNVSNIDRYLREYSEYCELVNLFNKLFGSRIFWVIGYVIIVIVEGFQIGLNCFAHVRLHRLGDDSCEFVGAATLTELSIYSVSISHVLPQKYFTIFFMFQILAFMFISACHQSYYQAAITKDLCYKLFLSRRFSPLNKEKIVRDIETKLCILMEHFESYKLAFTADGFFNINYSLITAVWTYMVSNLIISLTFKGD